MAAARCRSRATSRRSPIRCASGGYDTVNYVYNVMHQPTQRTDGNSVVTNYSYSDGDGLLSAIAYPATTSLNVGITYDSYDRAYLRQRRDRLHHDSFDDLQRSHPVGSRLHRPFEQDAHLFALSRTEREAR